MPFLIFFFTHILSLLFVFRSNDFLEGFFEFQIQFTFLFSITVPSAYLSHVVLGSLEVGFNYEGHRLFIGDSCSK